MKNLLFKMEGAKRCLKIRWEYSKVRRSFRQVKWI